MICLRQRFQKPDIEQDRHGQAQKESFCLSWTGFVLFLLHFVVQLGSKRIIFHSASPSVLCRILSQKFRFSGSERLR